MRLFSAITVGSLRMMPCERAYTSVFAVPRSIARSRDRVASYSAGRRRRDDFSGASARKPRSNSSMLCSIEFGRRLRNRIAVIPAALASIANNKNGMCDQTLLGLEEAPTRRIGFSPSAQSEPAPQCSCFQMGTVSFSVSMQ